VSGVDVDDCVSDTETICGDADADADVSTEASMPQLYFVSDLGSSSNSDDDDGGESDFDADVGPSWGCKILPKKSSEVGKATTQKSMCRRFYSTDCNDVDNCASSNDDDDFERRSLPSNFVTSLIEDSSREIEGSDLKLTSSGLKRSSQCEIIDSSSVSSEAENSSNGQSSDLSWIDRTPSESSLQLPFCPPVRVDYEDFPTAFRPTVVSLSSSCIIWSRCLRKSSNNCPKKVLPTKTTVIKKRVLTLLLVC